MFTATIARRATAITFAVRCAVVVCVVCTGCTTKSSPDEAGRVVVRPGDLPASAAAILVGEFEDDYGITYLITEAEWVQNPATKYHVKEWHPDQQFLIAQNDAGNPADGGLWTRIDWMRFDGMEPFAWGFCLTVFRAATAAQAAEAGAADRENPRTGCGGFPFSRMKRR